MSAQVFTWVDSFGQEVMEFLSSQNCLKSYCRHGGLEPERRISVTGPLLMLLLMTPAGESEWVPCTQLRCLSCICNAGRPLERGKILMQLQFFILFLTSVEHYAIETRSINGTQLYFPCRMAFYRITEIVLALSQCLTRTIFDNHCFFFSSWLRLSLIDMRLGR